MVLLFLFGSSADVSIAGVAMAWGAQAVFDFVVFALTMWHSLRRRRRGLRNHLLIHVYQGGAIYFGCVLCFLLGHETGVEEMTQCYLAREHSEHGIAYGASLRLKIKS